MKNLPVSVQCSRFYTPTGAEEIHWIIRPTKYAHFDTQLEWVEQAYEQTLRNQNTTQKSAVWRRFLCSDLINQTGSLVKKSFSNPKNNEDPAAVSWVGQTPATPSKVTLWAYHVLDADKPLEKSLETHTLSLKRKNLTHHWTTGITDNAAETSYEQTDGIFKTYNNFLTKQNITLAINVIRTWFFVQNVDTNYAGLVESRNDVFQEEGLTSKTHYIASTGIEGGHTKATTKVLMDSYAIDGIQDEQIQHLHALEHLSPTHIYGVAFERATAISYSDRKHIFISGTASIDKLGNTLHLGDIDCQLDRTLKNISALLQEADAQLNDMQIMIVYLRDTNDQQIVRETLTQKLPNIPFEIVTAPVCRPEWLIEIEAIAITSLKSPHFPSY